MPYSMEFIKPAEIETQSFAIIEAELRRRNVSCPANQMPILQRVIHTSADFDYIQNLTFSENAVEKALDALRNGADIITDTNMALSGINKKSLHALGGEAHCFMSDPDVAAEAKRRGWRKREGKRHPFFGGSTEGATKLNGGRSKCVCEVKT